VTPRLVALVLLAGVALRTWQFAANPSLWIDEVAIARQVLDRAWTTLLAAPLDYGQTAPPGFLFGIKAATWIFGPTDRAFRVYPFIASLASLFAFAYLARRLLSGAGALVALVLFACALPLIYFTTQTKQYSSDVLASIALMACTYELHTVPTSRHRRVLVGLGCIVPWFSQPGVIVAVALSAASPLMRPPTQSWSMYRARVAPVVAAWAVSAFAALLLALANTTAETRDYLERFWATGFMPSTFAEVIERRWPWEHLRAFIGSGSPAGGRLAVLAYPMPAAYFALAIAGVWSIWRRQRWVAPLVVAPVILTLAAAVARQYPFSDRVILFLLPPFLIAIGGVIDELRRYAANGLAVPLVSLAVLTPAASAIARWPPPYHTEPIKRVLERVESQRRGGDLAYVFYGAVPTVDMYVDQLGIDPKAYYAGGCHRGNTRIYLQELDAFRGRQRIWFVITHALRTLREREDMLRYLDAIGTRRSALFVASRRGPIPGTAAEAFLYDLSDTAHLQRAAARSFPLIGPDKRAENIRCEGPVSIPAARLNRIRPDVSR